MAKTPLDPSGPDFPTKKCPECYAYVPLDAVICPACKTRLGKVTKQGMASRLTNWKAYLIAAIAWLILILYLKWAFF